MRWLGVPDRLETRLVPERFGLVCVNAGGLQGRGLAKLLQLIRLLLASVSVRRVIRRNAINVVFTTGGTSPPPAILAARWCGIPWCCMNPMPSQGASPACWSLLQRRGHRPPAAAAKIPGATPVLTGTPVRSSFLKAQPLPAWVPQGRGRCWW